MDLNNIKNVYFVGIGGIGMSALARYFKANGCLVAGYDRTPSPLTEKMAKEEGIDINYSDEASVIPEAFAGRKTRWPSIRPLCRKIILSWSFCDAPDLFFIKGRRFSAFCPAPAKRCVLPGRTAKRPAPRCSPIFSEILPWAAMLFWAEFRPISERIF